MMPTGAEGNLKNRLRVGFDTKLFLPGFLLANVLLVYALSPAFLNAANISNVLTQAAPLAIVVIGQTFALLVRGLDLSVASVMATSAVFATSVQTTDDRMIPVLFGIAILLGVITGATNGYLVAKRQVSPFLATLATMIVLQGVRFLITEGSAGSTLPRGISVIGQDRLFGVPYNVMVLVGLAALFGYLLNHSSFGRKVYMVGGNPTAARLSGINVDHITIACYIICSVLAAVAGLVLVGFVGQVDQWTGRGYELDSIVAAVMGGVAITGGRGSIFGAILGVLILTVMFNAVILLGLPVEFQLVLKGVIVIVAAALYTSRN